MKKRSVVAWSTVAVAVLGIFIGVMIVIQQGGRTVCCALPVLTAEQAEAACRKWMIEQNVPQSEQPGYFGKCMAYLSSHRGIDDLDRPFRHEPSAK
jgi:hypothetical protein